MTDSAKCKQCGAFKSLDQFRKYYHQTKKGSAGNYNICKSCEKVNSRFKYLRKKVNDEKASDAELHEYDKIQELYELQRENGLCPPVHGRGDSEALGLVELMLEQQKMRHSKLVDVNAVSVPADLSEWLVADLSIYTPDYLQDEIVPKLQAKYRPQLNIDPISLAPVFDETYRDILNDIYKRFDEYEDNYEEPTDE